MSDWLKGPSKLNIDFKAAPYSPIPSKHPSIQQIAATLDFINIQLESSDTGVSFELVHSSDESMRGLHIIRRIQTPEGLSEEVFCAIYDGKNKKIDISFPVFMNGSQEYSRTNTNWQYVLKNLQKAIFVGLPEDIQLKFDQAKAVKLFDYFTNKSEQKPPQPPPLTNDFGE